jgi:hypothetical protein
LERAGHWFLDSGIREPGGGVARYHRTDLGENAPVSSEITGYAVSALAYLSDRTGRDVYRESALASARFLACKAWDGASSTFPFEPGSSLTYFFDTGIIIRGLLATWRLSGEEMFRERAHQGALSLAFDFLGDGEFHPIVSLPEKQPVTHEPRWSRSPGCYQLKSALAWFEIGDPNARPLFESVLAYSLRTHESFLTGERDREKTMDRLHAYCYFLEGLLAVADRPEVRRALDWGITQTGNLLREISPIFERSDVNAQLLRVRLAAAHAGVVSLNVDAAREEARRVASFQRADGGFGFGRKGSEELPYANPVSTAFALQALQLWEDHQKGEWDFKLCQLI